jgi:DNA-binding NarL/FixJ family response regulator
MLVRQGIRSLLALAPDIEVVAEAADGGEALSVVAESRPDVVLLDVRLPVRSGLEVLRELAASGCLPPAILLTTFDDDTAVLEGVRSGARGFLLKDVSLEELASAIRTVAGGGTVVRPAVGRGVLRGLERVRPAFEALEPPDPLTPREVEVLRLMAGGYSNREIADALGSAEGNVTNQASSILAGAPGEPAPARC